MRKRNCLVVLVLQLVSSTLALRADVTVRYKNDYKFAAFLSPAMTSQAVQQMDSSTPTAIQIKGDKGYSNLGKITYLMDFAKQEVTLLDGAGRRFATLPMKDFVDKLEASRPVMIPEVQRFMKSTKTNFSSRKTGRTDTIQGIGAEESVGGLRCLQQPCDQSDDRAAEDLRQHARGPRLRLHDGGEK
jgi:hypothetical protein